jgi:hypothetical protein
MVSLLPILSGCPPLFLRFCPDALDSPNAASLSDQHCDLVVRTRGAVFILHRMNFHRKGQLDLKIEFEELRHPLTVRTADCYVTDDRGRRINLTGVHYQTGPNAYITDYADDTGQNTLRDVYLLDPATKWLALSFGSGNEEISETMVLHLRGMEVGGYPISLVQPYRLDCDALRRERPCLQRWFGVGVFARYCKP